jgi:DNA (cytosine-5)-methyltransferase 1
MGWENAFLCENDPFCRRVLNYWFNKSKIYGDIRETDFSRWNGRIDVLTAGFPCQPFSCAGQRKGAGDDRYLWPEIIRVIREVRPCWFIGENVAGIVSMVQPGSEVDVENTSSLFGENYTETALEQEYIAETVCGDLERAGYTVRTVIIPACAVGAPHRRDRIFIVAHRTDAGTESLRERQNGIHERPAASDAIGNDAGRCGYSEVGRSPEESKGRKKERERIREVAERIGNKGTVTHANKLNGNISGFRAGEVSQYEASGIFGSITSPDATSEGLRGKMPRYAEMSAECFPARSISGRCGQNDENKPSGQSEQNIPDWRHFPTQPPVCRRDDGISERLAGITFPRWRNESIKAFGNAIVPQVMYEIFKAIDMTSNNLNK